MVTEKERKETMKIFRKTIKSIKRRNKTSIRIFIQYAYDLKEESKLSENYIEKWDDNDRKYMPGMLKVYLEGFESLKEIRYPINSELNEIYEFIKECLRRLENVCL